MKPPNLKTARCCVAALLVLAAGRAWAAPVVFWTGAGASPNWSAGANWNPGRPPADGDAVVFSGSPPGAANLVDISVRLDSLSYAVTAAAFEVHVAGGGGRTLSFDGLGIQNLTSGSGPIRQSIFADAGSTGSSIVFTGTSGINLGAGTAFRPVDVSALGGNSTGQVGGRVVFQDDASTGIATFNALRAEGASAGGAGAGALVFRNSAVATAFTTISISGGSAADAAGGQASFADGVRVEGIVNVLSGLAGGSGGRASFAGEAVAGLTSTLNQQGGQSVAGTEGVTTFRDTARLMGTAVNAGATAAGANGGRVEFRDQSRFDSNGYDGSLGNLQILNGGGSVANAGGGSVEFLDDSSARGKYLVIVNRANSEGPAGTLGGRTRFGDRAQAGELTIYNEAGPDASGAGQTSFENASSAGSARIVSLGGRAALMSGGQLKFLDDASAAGARIENNGGTVAGASGGETLFQGAARAGSATIVNAAGEIAGASGGVTRFAGNAGAGSATISNETSLSSGGGGRGTTFFAGSSSAQNARIDNQGGTFAINAFTTFTQSATAGDATITNFGGRAFGAGGGFTQFTDRSTAGASTLVMAAGATSGVSGGQVDFFSGTTAGNATLDLRGADVVAALGGRAYFHGGSSAGNSNLTVQGSQANNPGGPEGAIIYFVDDASAASARFVVGGNRLAFGSTGRVQFSDAASAANATFTTLAGFDAGGRLSFQGSALATASAGSARITNGSRATPSGSSGDFGGSTSFLAHSSADHASIVNEAGRTAFGAQTVFRGDGTAADATIVNLGGRAGDTGGITFFKDQSSAGRAVISNAAGAVGATGSTRFGDLASAAQAVLTANGASVSGETGGLLAFTDRSTAAHSTLIAEGGGSGGSGGRIAFQFQASGGSSRIVLGAGGDADAGGVLDISGVDVWLPIGSIEGGGLVNLGARSLIVGNRLATTFSGLIRGDAPPVFPSLTVQGTLTLTGANLYSGRTSIGDGVNPGSGKLAVANATGSATGSGDVSIQRGGTLAGSGFIAGMVALQDGGTIAPGDPVTLTLRDSLTWDGGGIIRLVLGADSAGSDHVSVGTLIRGADGPFVFDLVDAGVTAGIEYDLLDFDGLIGFTASDFKARGVEGSFALESGTLAFTAALAVPTLPEPSTCALLLAGLFMGCCTRRRLTRAARDSIQQARV